MQSNYKFTEDAKRLVCERYLAGLVTSQIALDFGVCQTSVDRLLRKKGIPSRRKSKPCNFSNEQLEEIVRRYRNGESSVALGKAYCTSPSNIRRFILNEGADMRTLSTSHRLYECDHNFFSRIETCEKSAYWAGFIAADGHVYEARNCLQITLSAKDKEHLEQFKRDLKSSHRIREYQPVIEKSNFGYIPKTGLCTSLHLNSPQLAHDLKRFGLTGAKSFTLQWPSLPDEMLRHFLRGYFDGDGSWFVSRSGPNARYLKSSMNFTVVSNTIFLQGMQSFLMQSCDVSQTKLYPHFSAKLGISNLKYCGNVQCARIARFLYSGATVFLQRKFDVVSHLI